jgi:hypothetical protein
MFMDDQLIDLTDYLQIVNHHYLIAFITFMAYIN